MGIYDTAAAAADRFSVPRPLVLAICEQESAFDPWAWNPEPKYRYLWDIILAKPFRKLTPEEGASEIPPTDFTAHRGVPADAEWWGQQASWGLMQVMGSVARERGFQGRFLSELCDPLVGLKYGCLHLAGYLKRFKDPYPALEAFNGGPGAVGKNPKYAGEVLARIEKFNT
jgi:hypothetical protein